MRKKRIPGFGLTTLAALALGAAPALAAPTLTINGNTVPADVRPLGGAAYVRLTDVAKALGMTVVRHGSAYELVKAGGANQVEGLSGKVGDVLFDGRWRFQVTDVTTAPGYTEQYAPDPQTVKPTNDGETLVIVKCEARNGLGQNQKLGFFPQYAHTALADEQGNSYPPLEADIRSAPHLRGLVAADVLPGAKTDFALVFSVPPSARPKDLVFTLTNDIGTPKSDVRVSLSRPGGGPAKSNPDGL